MSVTTTTRLDFRGTARGAPDFYRSVFGGRTVAVAYGDAGAARDESEADRVMRGEVAGDTGFHVMAHDVPSSVAHPSRTRANLCRRPPHDRAAA